MTTYKTYQEAKIANSDSDIAVNNNGDKFMASVDLKVSDAFSFKLCNPANHCMPVEQFLNDGYKFVCGDIVQNYLGVAIICDFNIKEWNSSTITNNDNTQFVLRAAVLEKPKPRTKVEYVKVEFKSDNEHLKRMIDGELFFSCDGVVEFSFNGAYFVLKEPSDRIIKYTSISLRPDFLYRRIEKPIEWREDVVEVAFKIGKNWRYSPTKDSLAIGGVEMTRGYGVTLREFY